jgi:pilus assembly protein CpaB
MNNRVLVILLSAFLVASGCSYLVYRIVSNRILVTHTQTATVLVAASDIKLGSVLRDTDLKTAEWAGPIPKGAVQRRQDAVGRGVVSNIYQGEPVLDSRLAPIGSGGGLAATIPTGMRAEAVKVDEVVGVAGFVTPGMHVDVLISGVRPGPANPAEGPIVKTLLQNIEVLSAGTDIQQDRGEAKPKQVQVVNLLVTPEQAEDLALAGSQMHIQLVLRNPLDTQVMQPPETAMGTIFSGETNFAPPPAPKAAAPTGAVRKAVKPEPAHNYAVQVYNGSKKSEADFPAGEGPQ